MPVVLPRRQAQIVIDRLRKRGIDTTVHYPPVHRLTFYDDLQRAFFCPDRGVCRTELTLPLHPRMMMSTVEFVVKSLAGGLGAEFPLEAIA